MCSNWAVRLPSAVTAVQSSSHILCCHVPRLIIGSIVNVMPGPHDHRRPRVVVVQHLDVGVELLADAVADERPDDAVAVRLGVVLDGPADVADRPARAHGLDAVPHALLGDAHELAADRVDVADEERGVGVAVHAVDVRGDVDVEDVAVLQHAGVGDAVADDLVGRRAHALREAVVVERGRIGVALDVQLVDVGVDLVGGDARAAPSRRRGAGSRRPRRRRGACGR